MVVKGQGGVKIQRVREFFCGDETVYLDYSGSYMNLCRNKIAQNYVHKNECRLKNAF